MANVIGRSPMTWEAQAVNALRHELAILFAEKISSGNAPPGLLTGLGGYFENPEDVFLDRYKAADSPEQPDRGLQRLWEEETSAANSLTLIQTCWVQYFPAYVESGWQSNIVHNYDLSQVEQLVNEGAYADAVQTLKKVKFPLKVFGDEGQIQMVSILLERANAGVRAGNLTLQARQAILSGEFGEGYASAKEAQDIYQQLEDTRRKGELNVYIDLAGEILGLRQELENLRGVGTPLDPVRTQRIVEIGRRLSALGDEEGTRQAQLALLLLGTGQRIFVVG